MIHYRIFNISIVVLTLLAIGIVQPAATYAKPPKMKMTTDIPKSILTPDKVETRIGTLEFFDGYPSKWLDC